MLLANAGNNFSNIIGRVVHQPGALVSFPQTFGIMTVSYTHLDVYKRQAIA